MLVWGEDRHSTFDVRNEWNILVGKPEYNR